MKKMRRKDGSQLNCVSFRGNAAHAASPIMLMNIPNPENLAGGLRPNLSEMKAIRIVVTTRVKPLAEKARIKILFGLKKRSSSLCKLRTAADR